MSIFSPDNDSLYWVTWYQEKRTMLNLNTQNELSFYKAFTFFKIDEDFIKSTLKYMKLSFLNLNLRHQQ